MYLQIYTRKASKDLENYQLVVLGLIALSKIYKTCNLKSVVPFVDDFFSAFLSAYRKTYGSNHVFIRLTKQWKRSID